MLRLLTIALLASVLVTPGVAAAIATQAAPPEAPDDCSSVTLVKSDAAEAEVDLYVTKSSWSTEPPEDPVEMLHFLARIVQDVRDFAEDQFGRESTTASKIQVEAILPKSDDPEATGVRFTFLVTPSSCTG